MKNGKKKSISKTIFVGIFSMFLFMSIMFIFIMQNLYGKFLEDTEIKYHLELTNNTKEQINVLINMINESSYSLISQGEVQKFMKYGKNDVAEAELTDRITTYMDDMKSINYSINNVHLLSTNEYWCTTNPRFDQSDIEYFKQYLTKYENQKSRKVIWTDFRSIADDNYYSSTSFIRPIFDSDTKEVYGIAIIDVSYESLYKLFTASSILRKDKALLINGNGAILFQYPLVADYTKIMAENPQIIGESTQIMGKLYNMDVIIVSEKINATDWNIVRFVQRDAATQGFQEMIRGLQIILAVMLLVSLCYTIFLTNSVTRPIKTLMQACNKVMNGDFSTHVDMKRKDEFGRLGDTFNSMLTQINESFAQERLEQKRKTEMEFQILQAQINPHFLYNTIDSIKWLAVMQGVDSIGEMSTALINLLKYNLGKVDGDTTLIDEVESVRNYIVLQKYRYTDTFEFTTMIGEEVASCKVLRFILQPLVENSIIHGFRDERGNYRIHIAGIIQDNHLHIKVIDNGAGMEKESTAQINHPVKAGARFSKIGVENIRERIKLHFGEEADLIFDSEPDVITVAEIILPVIRE
ncbi:histidine kinase [Lachnospiraceae bacterium ZAX-1]